MLPSRSSSSSLSSSRVTLASTESEVHPSYPYDEDLKHQEFERKSSVLQGGLCEHCNVKSKVKSAVVVSQERLWDELHYTARWGSIEGTQGMARLALSDEDREVRTYLVQEATRMGCEIKVDQMGNTFAILPGENNSIPPIGVGSHMDTQPAGGRYDGVLGVLGALEVLRSLKASGVTTFAPIAAINWTNEEGARFTPGCSGSAVWAAHTPLAQAYDLYDTDRTSTMRQELDRIGYLGKTPATYEENPLSCHFELHIEQRRNLQDADKSIGIVTKIQGIRWYRISVYGQRAHAGSTPMPQRADALVAASKMFLFLDAKAVKVSAVATVGVVELDRPSSNTIPGEVNFTIDFRHPSETTLDEFEATFLAFTKYLMADDPRISIATRRIWQSPAVEMNDTAVACARRAAEQIVGRGRMMDCISLAGHDSALTATRVPTSMIFVPSRDGISHAPEEFTSADECGIGAQVLLESVLQYDNVLRMEWESRNPQVPPQPKEQVATSS